jgi:hypothetical protein
VQIMLMASILMLVLLTATIVTALSTPNRKFLLPSTARNFHFFQQFRPRSVAVGLKSSLLCTKGQDDGVDNKRMDGSGANNNNINARAWNSLPFSACVASISGSAAVFTYCTDKALAVADVNLPDEELVGSLPPPWIPLLFAIVVVGGTALLTGSLGDVIADGKSLNNNSPPPPSFFFDL